MRHATLCFVLFCSACAGSSEPQPEPAAKEQPAGELPAADAKEQPADELPAASGGWQEDSLGHSFREDDPTLASPGSLRVGPLERAAVEVKQAIPKGLVLRKVRVENSMWEEARGRWSLSFEVAAAPKASTLLIRYLGPGGTLEGCELAPLPALPENSWIGYRASGPRGEIPVERIVIEVAPADGTVPDPAKELSFAPGDSAIQLVSYELEPVDEEPGYRLKCVFQNNGPDCDALFATSWRWRPGAKSNTSGSDRAISGFTRGSRRKLVFDAQSKSKIWRVRLAVKATRSPAKPR